MNWSLRLLNLRNGVRLAGASLLRGRGLECLLPTFWFWLTRELRPFTTRSGYRIENRQQLICWWAIHIQQHLFTGWSLAANAVVVDIGANYGVFGYEIRDRYPGSYIIGFEPHEPLARFCSELDHPKHGKVYNEVYQTALSDTAGNELLYVRSSEGSWTATINDVPVTPWEPACVKPTSVLKVPSQRLDEFKLRPDLVKIDVDGGEVKVVRGGVATLAQVRHVIAETENPKQLGLLLNLKYLPLTEGDYLFQRSA